MGFVAFGISQALHCANTICLKAYTIHNHKVHGANQVLDLLDPNLQELENLPTSSLQCCLLDKRSPAFAPSFKYFKLA